MDSSPDVGAQDPAAIADIGRVRDYKIAAHSGLLSISAAVVGLLSYGCTLLLANMLSAGEYSQFAAAQMLLGIVGIVASALVPLPLSHIVATHAQGSTGRREGIAFAFFVSVIAGTLSAILASGVTLAFAGPAMAGAVAFAAMLLFTVAAPAGWLQGELHFMRYAVISIGEVAVRFLFSFCVAVFSWGAVGGILGFAVGALVLFAIPLGFYRDVKWSPQVLHHRWRWTETGDIALTLCVVSVLVGADVVIVAFLDRGSPATAGFQALSTIAKGPVYVAAGTALVAFPLLRAPRIPDSEVLRSALRSFVQLAGVAFVVISTAPHSLVGIIFPARYHDSLDLLPWLGLAGIGYAALTVFATVLLALKAYSRCKWGLVVASTLMTGGILLGWQLADVSGIAVGCAIGSVLAGSVLATMMSPFLPVGEGMAALKGAVLIVSIGSVLAFASLWPLLWSVLAAGLGLGVLLYQRGNISGHQSLVSYGRRLASSFQATRGPAGFPTPRLTAGWKTGSWLGPAASSRASRAIDAKCEGARRVPAFGVEHRPTMSAAVMLRPMNKTTSLALFLAIAGVAFAIRGVGLTRSFELWADEMLYASLGLSVSNGQLPNLPDGPFFLHPPGFFLLEGAADRVFGISGTAIDVVMELRWLNAAAGAISVALAYFLVRRVGSAATAWGATVVLAFDPFVLRNNSHLFLESSGMACVLAALLLVVIQIQAPRGRHSVPSFAAAGLLMGYSVLTKDFFALSTLLPVGLAFLWKRTLSRREALVLGAGTVIPYASYLVVLWAQGFSMDWIVAKTSGAQRLVGMDKSTGFNAAGSPDLMSRLLDQLQHFGTSYVLLGLCPLAAAFACFCARRERRLTGLVGLVLGLYGAYSAAFGTFEEQYGYGVIVTSVLVVAVMTSEFMERHPRYRRPVNAFGIALLVVTFLLGIRAESITDNGYATALEWVRSHLPSDARVSVTNSTGELAFSDDPRFGVWPSAPLMYANGVRYMLTQSLPTSQGYGYAQPGMLRWLASNATPVFRTDGPTNGATTIWMINPIALQKAAQEGIGAPAGTYETER